MRLTSICQLVIGLTLLFFCLQTNAQTTSLLENTPTDISLNADTEANYRPFTILHTKDKDALKLVPNAQFLTLDESVLQQIVQDRPTDIRLQIPYRGQVFQLLLSRVEVVTQDFSVLNERESAVAYQPGVHYRGSVASSEGKAAAAFSFFDDEIMGVIASPELGNLVLGKLAIRGNAHQYIFYSDREMTIKNPFNCHAEEKETHDDGDQPEMGSLVVNGCVRVFLEVDNELFVEKGSSVQTTVNYLLGAWNQAAILYTTEQINMTISQILVWTTPDFYNTSSSATVLNQFRGFRTSFNGDLAHLVGTGGNNLGGIAYVDVLCSSGYNFAYSDITASFSNVPTFSWTVEVMTHEMGHNLGSNHTQWCGWTGGPIDNCVSAEGGCSPGPTPTNGGTIMSYCHLSSVGINFNNGFGPQPGDKIRSRVGAATCLSSSCPPPSSCVAPSSLSVSGVSGTSAVVAWESTSGAGSYTLRYRAVGASQWTTLTNAVSPTTISSLPANDEVEVTVQSVCGGTSSDYRNGVIFLSGSGGGGGGGTSCDIPTNLNTSPSTVSALTAWSAANGATSYEISWKLATSSTWTANVSSSAPSYNITGLVAATNYNVRVRTVCGATTSAYATTSFTTTAGGTNCGVPTNLGASVGTTSANVNWSAVSGATAYNISWKLATSGTWGANVSSSTPSYNITGLVSATSYNVRVQTVCGATTSAYATGSFTTNSSGTGCGVPTNLVANPSTTSASVVWTGVGGATSYHISWKTAISNTWSSTITTTAPSYNIGGLASATNYNVRVRTVCGTTTSAYTTISFTTTSGGGTCNAPSNLGAGVSPSAANISWLGANGALSYNLQWKLATSSSWGSVISVTNATSYLIGGLSASTGYNVRVQTVCAGGVSAYITGSFTTQSGGNNSQCSIPTNFLADYITGTTARVSWTAAPNAVHYTLQVKRSSATAWLTFANLPVTQVTLQGLLTSTSYDIRIRTNCSNGSSSDYSPISTFTTAAFMPPSLADIKDSNGPLELQVNDDTEPSNVVATMQLSPNPASQRVLVSIDLPVETPLSVQITDAYGRRVRQEKVIWQTGALEMDLTGLAPGIYFVSAVGSGVQVAVQRLIVQ